MFVAIRVALVNLQLCVQDDQKKDQINVMYFEVSNGELPVDRSVFFM